jgi:hypothetical protein
VEFYALNNIDEQAVSRKELRTVKQKKHSILLSRVPKSTSDA